MAIEMGNDYFKLHSWVVKSFGKPSICQRCGTTEAKRYEWSSNGKYIKDKSDWERLCVKCHRIKDNVVPGRFNLGKKLTEEHKSKIARQGEVNASSKLKNEQVLAIRLLKGKQTISAVSREFNVARITVRRIQNFKAWKCLENS